MTSQRHYLSIPVDSNAFTLIGQPLCEHRVFSRSALKYDIELHFFMASTYSDVMATMK
ncbi:hypothetical protein L4C36_07350 [Photobacterium japonica]|uniref:hypothetical protein n=1 Tax=Photobacterium japonica TaxID=2910235 RepID=UPI003D11C718